MKIIYHNRHQTENDIDAKYVDLDTLLKESNFLSLNAPLTEETRHIIDAAALSNMKDTAFLINVAWG